MFYNRSIRLFLLTSAVIPATLAFGSAAMAASATANCGNGNSVTCSGVTCVAIDNVGCGCKDNYGNKDIKVCNAGMGMEQQLETDLLELEPTRVPNMSN